MKTIKFIICVIIITLLAKLSFANSAKQNEAQNLIRAALEALGGEAKLRELKSIQFEGIGHNFWVEQSERPEGPWIVGYIQTSETRDLVNNRVRIINQTRHFQSPNWSPELATIVTTDASAFERTGSYFPNSKIQAQGTLKNLALAPEKVLFNALEAKDLRIEKEIELQNVRQKVVKFTWNQIPVTLYLNTHTNLPTAVETLEYSLYEHFNSIWGDFTTRTYYSLWNLETGGLRYPHQWDTEKFGKNVSSFTVTKLQLNVPVKEEQFNIPDDIKQKFTAQPLNKIADLPLGSASNPAKEIAPDVVKIAGRWDVAFVKQNDGIVIIEAPIGSGYSVKVLEEAKRRFPDSKVKAVITTSDAFPHLGGVREYAAQGIPIYALDVNRPILERVLAAPHTFQPDTLQKKPRKANFKIISGKTLLGDGANRLEIYPIRSESGERMMMVYFPEHKLLYASDLVQKQRNGTFFMPQYLTEIIQATTREKLQVNNVFAFHTEMIPWSEVTTAVEKAVAEK